MKRISGDRIEIMSTRYGDGGLIMNGSSIEDARKTIDEFNEKSIADGWRKEPKKYLIVCKEWYRWENDDGTFIKSEEYVNIIEKYPA